MRINKKFFSYVFIAVISASTGLFYAVTAKNIWKPKSTEAKEISEDKNMDDPIAATPSAFPVPVPAQPISEQPTAPAPAAVPVASPAIADAKAASEYPLHKDISTTYFWAGEEAGKDNKNISNLPSAWDEEWVKHFGGIDDPKKRTGSYPSGFTPKENPFYFALPYNDFNGKGKQKNDAAALAMWASGKKFGAEQSMCKNQWIRITKNGKSAYAQWEDVGPFGEDDKAYVFGGSAPKSKENKNAGLDVSPAVHDYLALGDMDKTDWQFVDAKDVPQGPWKNIITPSQIYWK
jgi:hypothetical protein